MARHVAVHQERVAAADRHVPYHVLGRGEVDVHLGDHALRNCLVRDGRIALIPARSSHEHEAHHQRQPDRDNADDDARKALQKAVARLFTEHAVVSVKDAVRGRQLTAEESRERDDACTDKT